MTTRAFDLFFAPFAASPWLGLVAISFLTGVVALLVFRYTSSQRGIRGVKNQIVAHLLEVWLYRDEMRVVLRAQIAVVRDNLKYLGYALVPLACMVLPMAVLLVQTDLRYGHRALRVGEQTILAVHLLPGASESEVSLVAPPGLAVETPAVRMPTDREVDWRLRAVSAGRHELRLKVGGAEFTKTMVVGSRLARLSSQRVGAGLPHFFHPGEPPLPNPSPAAWVTVTYPDAPLPLLGWQLHWIWPWLVLSMLFGYVLKGPLRVQV
jgi:hypothetical protein